MKKFMKRCLILVLVFAVIGTILGIAGGSVAGRATVSQVVETVTGGRVHLNLDWNQFGFTMGDGFFGSIFGDSDEAGQYAVDTGIYDIDDATMFDKGRDVYKGDVDKYCPGGGIRHLDVEVGGCSFETEVSDDDNIYLEVKSAHKFQGFVKDGTLYIKAANGSLTNWSDVSDFRIILYLPEDYRFDEADVSMGAGKMRLVGLDVREASLDVGAGQITVEDVCADELEISIGAGEIALENMEVYRLDVTVGMGYFAADGAINGSAQIECSMGNVEMELDGAQKDFNYQLEGSMGNIDLGNESFSGFSQERDIDNGADKDMEVECSMGNITIKFRD